MKVSILPSLTITPEIIVSRLLCGLWQIADIEKDGGPLNPTETAHFMRQIVANGFTGFDMADHYGSAELIAGAYRRDFDAESQVKLFTKWCPEPGFKSAADVAQGVQQRLDRLGVPSIDLLQFHWWRYDHPGYLDCLGALAALCDTGLISALGLTNFDTDHLRLALSDGIPIKTNQVCFSLIDRRPAGRMSVLSVENDVKLLCYGVLAGGFLSEKWLDAAEPNALSDWSKSKYKRFIDQSGGWNLFQNLLRRLKKIADRHRVSISDIAIRWVLEQPATGAVILGARLGENDHSAKSQRIFDFPISEHELLEVTKAAEELKPLPGDCGDEYRVPPFLTASGDLSHHLSTFEKACRVEKDASGDTALIFPNQSEKDPMTAIRSEGQVLTLNNVTALKSSGEIAAAEDPGAQVIFCLDKAAAALDAFDVNLNAVTSISVAKTSEHFVPIIEDAIQRRSNSSPDIMIEKSAESGACSDRSTVHLNLKAQLARP